MWVETERSEHCGKFVIREDCHHEDQRASHGETPRFWAWRFPRPWSEPKSGSVFALMEHAFLEDPRFFLANHLRLLVRNAPRNKKKPGRTRPAIIYLLVI
jgi:hypothetical protein